MILHRLAGAFAVPFILRSHKKKKLFSPLKRLQEYIEIFDNRDRNSYLGTHRVLDQITAHNYNV